MRDIKARRSRRGRGDRTRRACRSRTHRERRHRRRASGVCDRRRGHFIVKNMMAIETEIARNRSAVFVPLRAFSSSWTRPFPLARSDTRARSSPDAVDRRCTSEKVRTTHERVAGQETCLPRRSSRTRMGFFGPAVTFLPPGRTKSDATFDGETSLRSTKRIVAIADPRLFNTPATTPPSPTPRATVAAAFKPVSSRSREACHHLRSGNRLFVPVSSRPETAHKRWRLPCARPAAARAFARSVSPPTPTPTTTTLPLLVPRKGSR